jgi:hypothetical protein
MSLFTTLSREEQTALYKRACEFVATHLKDSNSPDVRLGPPDSHSSRLYMQCTINGLNRFNRDAEFYSLMNEVLPGAKITDDPISRAKMLMLPIKFERTETDEGDAFSSNANYGGVGAPTLEAPLLLLLANIVLGGIMYYRYTISSLI